MGKRVSTLPPKGFKRPPPPPAPPRRNSRLPNYKNGTFLDGLRYAVKLIPDDHPMIKSRLLDNISKIEETNLKEGSSK